MVMAPTVHAALLIFDPYWYLELLYTIAMVSIIDYIKIYVIFIINRTLKVRFI
jgi:hypothetical protein